MTQHHYNSQFMEYADRSSTYSARRISMLLRPLLQIRSVLDVGCAKGTWLNAWKEAGVEEIMGVDGGYVDPNTLVIARDCFVPTDLAERLELGHRFDLVQSLEVAEHIRADAADQFVANLVRHSAGIILFSAAPPGQGGEFHVNEQPYDYWREKFRRHGFEAYDYVRPLIAADTAVSFWYRYNTILYVHINRAPALPANVRMTRISSETEIQDIASGWFRLRKRLIRHLPFTISQQLARV
ncbi:MAG TPA: class I SAM-dependent methyltransferase, partial [Rudaea sp.]|nr:class I SAM-dependent methyltransferase [Rudaea sp.]